MKVLIALILCLASLNANARIFSLTEASFAAYFKGNIGTSYIKDDPYEKSSGSQTEFSDEAPYNWSGEVGFIFPAKDYAFRLGLAIITPSLPSDIKGKNSSGTPLMTVDSSVYGFFPVGHFEYYIIKSNTGRLYVSVGGGLGKVSMKNEYSLTAAGDAAYTTPNNFSDRASQYTYMVETAVGFEMGFIHAVTVSFDLGYRYAVARELEYDNDGTGFNGAHGSGDPVINSDGHHKSLDFGGVFTGLSFRFYFN